MRATIFDGWDYPPPITVGNMRCEFVKQNDQRCRAQAVNGSEYCFFHSPENEGKRLEAATRGGAASKKNQTNLAKRNIKNADDVMEVLEETINLLRGSKIHPNYSNSIFIGCNTFLKAYEQSKLLGRLRKLETALEEGFLVEEQK